MNPRKLECYPRVDRMNPRKLRAYHRAAVAYFRVEIIEVTYVKNNYLHHFAVLRPVTHLKTDHFISFSGIFYPKSVGINRVDPKRAYAIRPYGYFRYTTRFVISLSPTIALTR